MVGNSEEAIPNIVLPLAIFWNKRSSLDLYNKSRMMGDYHVSRSTGMRGSGWNSPCLLDAGRYLQAET